MVIHTNQILFKYQKSNHNITSDWNSYIVNIEIDAWSALFVNLQISLIFIWYPGSFKKEHNFSWKRLSNNERTKWIIQRIEQKYCFLRQMIENHSNEFENEFSKRFGKNFRFFWMNDIFTNFKKRWFFAERTIFWTNFWKKTTVFFTERTIFLNEQFYWTILQWENERYRWKKNLRTDEIFFLNNWKKLTKWFVHKWWTNKIKNSNLPIT